MNIYIKLLKNFLFVFCLFLCISGNVWADKNNMSVSTSLVNGTTIGQADLIFNYTIKYNTPTGQLKYKLPEKVLINNKKPYRYGNTYRVTLQEGENKISIAYSDGEQYFFDTYFYYLDTTGPYINASGIYNHMITDKSHIKFSVNVGDFQSTPEALEVHVYLNDIELKEQYGFYQGLLKQSPLLGKKQKVVTNDKQPTGNIIKITAKDALDNQTIKSYHVIFAEKKISFPQLRYLIEKVPGLLPLDPQYDVIGHYSEVGVALDDSNITVLGTYGGYVLLGHDQPIFNGLGDDLLVNSHWSSAGYPLTSVWVMQDTNNNHIPDDEWYYLADNIDVKREIINSKVAYDLKNIGLYMDDKGNNKRIVMELPLRTAYSTPYFRNAKAHNTFDFSSSKYSLYGNLKVFHDEPIESLIFGNKGYDLDNARTLEGEAITLDKIDFVKVYTNTLDLQSGVGSVMPAVNYVLSLHDTGKSLTCETGAFKIINELPEYNKGDSIRICPNDWAKMIQYTQIQAQVNEDYVFVLPEDREDNHLPFKLEEEGVEIFYPHNRATLESVPFKVTSTEKLTSLTWSELMSQDYFIKNKLKDTAINNREEGQLELLQIAINKRIKKSLEVSFLKLHNNYDLLLKLKWQLDYLSDEDFFQLPVKDRMNLEYRLLQMINYTPSSYTIKNTLGSSFTIKPINNIAYNLSKEELERQIKPDLKITHRPKADVANIYSSFNIAFYKSDKIMTRLYRPIRYQLTVGDDWTPKTKLYFIDSSGDIEIPVQRIDALSVEFVSNRLGWFYIVN